MNLQNSHLEDRDAQIILLSLITMKFFPNQFFPKVKYIFFAFWRKNQEAFSERPSLVSAVLQGLVKICKSYMEVNHFFVFVEPTANKVFNIIITSIILKQIVLPWDPH